MIHGARRRAEVEGVLHAVLLEHHFLKHLRERVAAGVGRVRLSLGNSDRMHQ